MRSLRSLYLGIVLLVISLGEAAPCKLAPRAYSSRWCCQESFAQNPTWHDTAKLYQTQSTSATKSTRTANFHSDLFLHFIDCVSNSWGNRVFHTRSYTDDNVPLQQHLQDIAQVLPLIPQQEPSVDL